MYPLYKAINQKLNVIHKTAEHIPPHLHQAVEFVYVTKGTLAFGVGQELFPMEEGDFAVAFPNMIHHGSVYNFVSLLFCLIPEAGCGQSPQALINTGFPNISGK